MHFVTGGPFGLHGFGRFAGLPSEDLHGVIYLIVLGFAAAGIAAMLFFCEESNAGKAFRAIRKACPNRRRKPFFRLHFCSKQSASAMMLEIWCNCYPQWRFSTTR